MKYFINGILLTIMVMISNCNSERDKKDDWCKSVAQTTDNYIYTYEISNNLKYLDSALILTNKAIEDCPGYIMLMNSRKLDILTKKQDFAEAISFIESFETPFLNGLDYYNNYLLKRFTAMQYQLEGDISRRNEYLKSIIEMLEKVIQENRTVLDTLILHENVDELLGNTLSIPYVQYYYIKSVLLGIDVVKNELDSLNQTTDINEEFLDFIYQYSLDNDIMNFSGL